MGLDHLWKQAQEHMYTQASTRAYQGHEQAMKPTIFPSGDSILWARGQSGV